MKLYLIYVLLMLAFCITIAILGYCIEQFFKTLRLVGCREVYRVGQRDNDIIYEVHYQNGRTCHLVSTSGSRLQRELERVATSQCA